MKALPGPLEKQAQPVTAENPVPRRSYQVPPDDPFANEPDSFAVVTLQVMLDAAGQVAEYSADGRRGAPEQRTVRASREISRRARDRIAWVATGPAHSEATRTDAFGQLVASLVSSAPRGPSRSGNTRPPFEAPLAFDVDVHVRGAAAAAAATATAAGVRPLDGAPAASAATGDELTARPHGSAAATTAAAGDELAPRLTPPPPPPPPPPGTGSYVPDPAFAEGALRVGGTIKPPTKVRNVNPIYPPDAQTQGVQGVVILEARIEADGTVSRTRILRRFRCWTMRRRRRSASGSSRRRCSTASRRRL